MLLACVVASTKAKAVEGLTTMVDFSGMGIATNYEAANDAAYADALTKLIQKHFDTTIRLQETIQQSRTSVTYAKDLSIEVNKLNLSGIRLKDGALLPGPNGQFKAVNVYTIPKSILDAAIKRQRLLNKNAAPTNLRTVPSQVQASIIGQPSPHRSDLHVTAIPQGTMVTVDGRVTLPTPFTLRGYLEPGEHELFFDHPNHLSETKIVRAMPGKAVIINSTLERASVKIQLQSVPGSALAIINGVNEGPTPVSISAFAGDVIKVRLEHPDTEPLEQQVHVYREPAQQIAEFKLRFKPTTLQVTGPEIVGTYRASIDRKSFDLLRGRTQNIGPGTYNVCFASEALANNQELDCRNNCCKEIEVKPGQNNLVSFYDILKTKSRSVAARIYSDQGLIREESSETTTEKTRNEDDAQSEHKRTPWSHFEPQARFLISIGQTNAFLNTVDMSLNELSISWENELWHLLYVQGGLSLPYAEKQFKNANVRATNAYGIEGALGIKTPTVTAIGRKSFLGVEYRAGVRRFDLESSAGANVKTTLDQQINGIAIRFQTSGETRGFFIESFKHQATAPSSVFKPIDTTRTKVGLTWDY